MPTLNWIGKDKVVTHHNDVPYRVLEKKYTYGDTPDSGNMIIHGDNLEALKALLPQYEGKIKCIYIDPPYNTGNEGWVYNDNVNDPHIRKWLGQVVGKEADDLTRHDKWLCMMYPRLVLLQRLLSEDGAIFISIDDHEQANLKMICDEIFGKNNFVDQFIWYVNDGHTDNQDEITLLHEYILCFAKNRNNLYANHIVDPSIDESSKILNSFAENSITKNGAKNPPSIITLKKGFPCEVQSLFKPRDECIDELIESAKRDGFISRETTKKYNVAYPALLDDMIVENGELQHDCRVFSGWMNNAKLNKFIDNKCKPLDDNGSLRFFLSKNGVIYYRRDDRNTHYIQTVLEKMGTTETNKYMLEGMNISFDFPKPTSLIQYILSIYAKEDSIILDSFAGSGTTAHAVLNLNRKDGGHRKFILCEMCDYAETITAERVRCVMKGYKYKGKIEDEIYIKELTPNDLKDGTLLLRDAESAIEDNLEKYDKISKPIIKDNCLKVIGTIYKTERMQGTGGSFDYYELGETIFDPATENLNDNADTEQILRYVWFSETNSAYTKPGKESHPYLLGSHNRCNYYFYYIKGEETCLDWDFLNTLTERDRAEMYIIYADRCVLTEEEMLRYNIRFKKMPRDIKRV